MIKAQWWVIFVPFGDGQRACLAVPCDSYESAYERGYAEVGVDGFHVVFSVGYVK